MKEGSKKEESARAAEVLRLFGVSQMEVQQAAAALPKECGLCPVHCLSRGGETLVALEARDAAGLRKAEQNLRSCLGAALYARGETDLPVSAVQTLEEHHKLLGCADAAAGALVDPRLEAIAGAEKVYDFGAESYAHPEKGPKLRQLAEKLAAKTEGGPAQEGAARARALCRLGGVDFAAACVEREGGVLLILGARKGFWLRSVWEFETPGLWLLDMIRRAAAGLPQAEGTRWQKYGAPLEESSLCAPPRPAEATPPADPEPPPPPAEEAAENPDAWVPERSEPLPRPAPAAETPGPQKKKSGAGKWLFRLAALLLILALGCLAAAWYYTGGDLEALPEMLGLREFNHSGASLMQIFVPGV